MTHGARRALVIGVANYDNISSLPEAVLNDARDIASTLRAVEYCGFPPNQVQVLLDDQATLEGIRSGLADLASSSVAQDTVVIFFSGHGARFPAAVGEISALLPVDCQANNLPGTALLEVELTAALSAINAQRLVVLVDACHAGGVAALKTHREEDPIRTGFSEKALHQLTQGTGRVVIASSRAQEFSLVMNGARNSVFTQYLLEAFKGKARTTGDGLIRVFDVFNHVAENVRTSFPGRQHPIFKASDLEDNFPVALDRGGLKAPTPTEPVEPDSWREIETIMADLYPAGPTDQEVWARAGGDLSRLRLYGTGRANWFGALRNLKLGGGGQRISLRTLLETATGDFPHHPELAALKRQE
ncbi:caspase family protein [Streptomyces sp. SID13666]|uniref:caspase family protein n=1 Tax=unclassified Streptomyces TaxID=2593676 RepID=UPI0013BF543B|nr:MULTISPECIES: caspase family protein [unclassified Streptomyces]MCZ4097418.1 caspase family protein [Streptomyces sp. H39-C1]NEA53972.1 caspase family protein [Streptomyces sp. SID13666]